MMKPALFAAFACLFLYGCATPLERSVQPPGPDESLLIMGVNQPYMITLGHGSIENGEFRISTTRPPALKGEPVGGYMTGRAKAGSILALTTVSSARPNSIMMDTTYNACQVPAIMLLTVPAGKVIYLGSVEFAGSKGRPGVAMRYENRLAQAQQYVDDAFPALRGKLEYIAPDFLARARSCEFVQSTGSMYFYGLRTEPRYKTVEEAARH
jgi:hypothetical protein